MGWRLRIEHTTRVRYSGPVLTSFNEARMTPLTLPSQTTIEARVTAGPGVPVWTYNDYWGSHVSVFDLPDPHEDLQIRATATPLPVFPVCRRTKPPRRSLPGCDRASGTCRARPACAPTHRRRGARALDPTSGAPVGERHVVVARGRDYADVPPLKGIYHGAPDSVMDVTVTLTRLA